MGAVGYFALTGQNVFQGRSLVEVCSHHLHTKPEPPSSRLQEPVPADLEALVLDCLEEALALPEDARTDLLEALIESLDAPAEPVDEVESAWADEIARRLRAVETGSVKPVPWEEARKAIFGSRDADAPRR